MVEGLPKVQSAAVHIVYDPVIVQYTWEQEEFDAITRMTRISLHFRLENTKKTIKNAFSYQWRL
jgi:hypothetical protein